MPNAPASQAPVQKVITPNDQFIRAVLDAQRSDNIDIYQCEFEWTYAQVWAQS